jgi:hypothetical protein
MVGLDRKFLVFTQIYVKLVSVGLYQSLKIIFSDKVNS